MTERDTLIEALARHRGFLLQAAQGLSEEQARTRSTVSELTVAGLLKHVADTEEEWMAFAARGAQAMSGSGVYSTEVDWEAAEAQSQASGDDWAGSEWVDTRFELSETETLDRLRERVLEVAAATEEFLGSADLEAEHDLPEAPWFEQGARWSVRRVALHVLAEVSQHAGHADIIREALDGQKTMG